LVQVTISISYFQDLLQSLIDAVGEKDLDKFNQTFKAINTFFHHAQYQQNHHERFGDSLCQQVYYQAITPIIKQLMKDPIWKDTVYGKIIAHIPDVMIQEGHLSGTCHFIDLGSGIGNMVCLMSIRTGCSSIGVEVMAQPAALAKTYVQQSILRAEGLGMKIGKVQLIEADMLKSELVRENIAAVDVVLVTNRLFSASNR
jgi:H3 lysine-79-specific histone-lysine N-methyltransferase